MTCYIDEQWEWQSDYSHATAAACEALGLLERHHLTGE